MIATKYLIVNILFFLAISARLNALDKTTEKALDCGDNSLVSYDSKGLPKRFPWSVYLMVQTGGGDSFCDGVIISPNHILTYKCSSFYLEAPVAIFFRRRKVVESIIWTFDQWPSQTIKNPNWTHSDKFYILTLEKSIVPSTKHAPICISDYVPKADITDPVYFGWEVIDSRDDKNSIWATVHHAKIQKESLRPGAVSYLKDGKWYLAGINMFKYHYPFKNQYSLEQIVKIYVPFNRTIPIISTD